MTHWFAYERDPVPSSGSSMAHSTLEEFEFRRGMNWPMCIGLFIYYLENKGTDLSLDRCLGNCMPRRERPYHTVIPPMWTEALLQMLIPACVFLGMGKCVDSCGTDNCAMCGSVIAALVGLAGSGYCFMISAVALMKGPYCYTVMGWRSPFETDGGKYLFAQERWSDCVYPKHIVEWNVTLLSILLGLSTLEFLICFLQFISGLVNAVCRPCCYKQEYSLNA